MGEGDQHNDWTGFLRCWSEEWAAAQVLEDVGHFGEDEAVALRQRWLGFPGADEERLAAAEARIGRRLPPSLRSFLKVTDGWLNAGNFVDRLAGTADLAPLDEAEAARYAGYEDWMLEEDVEPSAEVLHRHRMWHRAVRLGLGVDVGVLVLDPGDVGPDGEWAVYLWHSWWAGPTKRFPSFRAFMHAKYREFHALAADRGMVNETTEALDAAVEFGRDEAYAGRWERAANIFAEAAAYGRPGARELAGQLDAFVTGDRSLGLYQPPLAPGDRGEALPVYLAAQLGRSWPPPQEIVRQQPEEVRDLAARIADGTDAYEPGGGFGAFIARARELARWGNTDGAWRQIRSGLPHWEPPATGLLAPLGLLADPLLAPVVTPERSRELLTTPRAGRTGPMPEPVPDLDPPGLDWLATPDGWWRDGYRLVLVEGVDPERLVELIGHEDQDGLAAPATADELRHRRIESGNRRAGNPWDDRALMTVGRAGNGWSFAFADEYASPNADHLRSPAVPASRATPDGLAVALWCTPGPEPQGDEPTGPFSFHVSVARGGELAYALTVEPPRRRTGAQHPAVHRVGTPPEAFHALPAPTAGSTESADAGEETHRSVLQAVADEFGVALPRFALLQGRLHSIETISWSRGPRAGDRWLSITMGERELRPRGLGRAGPRGDRDSRQ